MSVKYQVCNTCGKEKELSSFHKNKRYKNGRRNKCKTCVKEYRKEYYKDNSEKLKEYSKKFYRDNQKYYREYNREHKGKEYNKKLRNSVERNFKEFRDKLNQSKFCSKCDEYKSFDKYYKLKNGKYSLYSWCKKCNTKRHQKRKENDIGFKIRCNLSKRLWKVLKNKTKLTGTMELVGCSINELKKHIEEKFKEGMTWSNYGNEWHVDHIIPCDVFDLTEKHQQEVCFHYSNLQPLWAEDNHKKSNSIPDLFQGIKLNLESFNEEQLNLI